MRILLDTNILARLSNPVDVQRPLAVRSVQALTRQNHLLCVVPQVLYEFWVVATRPADVNGLALLTEAAKQEIEHYQHSFDFFPDTPAIFEEWLNLVFTHQVSGRPTHDTRLAAAMNIHGLDALLTFNTPDFKRFGIDILHPKDVS